MMTCSNDNWKHKYVINERFLYDSVMEQLRVWEQHKIVAFMELPNVKEVLITLFEKYLYVPYKTMTFQKLIYQLAAYLVKNQEQIAVVLWTQQNIKWDELDWKDLVSVSNSKNDFKGTDDGIDQESFIESDKATIRQRTEDESYNISKFSLYQRLSRMNWISLADTFIKGISPFFYNTIPHCDYWKEQESDDNV